MFPTIIVDAAAIIQWTFRTQLRCAPVVFFYFHKLVTPMAKAEPSQDESGQDKR